MEQSFTCKSADVTSLQEASVISLASRRLNRSQITMVDPEVPRVGMVYRSRRTDRTLTVTAIRGDQVYYEVDGFSTQAPLFLSVEKFMHLVGLDRKPE